MSELNRKVTHSLSYLSNLPSTVNTFFNIFDNGMKELRNKKGDEGKTIRKINKDLKDNIEDELEKLLIEFTIYNTDMTEIILNRNNPDVVYALRRFIEERQKLKEIKKRLNNFVVKTEAEIADVRSTKDYVKVVAYNSLYSGLTKFNGIVEKSYSKLVTLTKDVVDEVDKDK